MTFMTLAYFFMPPPVTHHPLPMTNYLAPNTWLITHTITHNNKELNEIIYKTLPQRLQ